MTKTGPSACAERNIYHAAPTFTFVETEGHSHFTQRYC